MSKRPLRTALAASAFAALSLASACTADPPAAQTAEPPPVATPNSQAAAAAVPAPTRALHDPGPRRGAVAGGGERRRRDGAGRTALENAERHGQAAIVSILRGHA